MAPFGCESCELLQTLVARPLSQQRETSVARLSSTTSSQQLMQDLSQLPPARRGPAPAPRPLKAHHPATFWGPRKRRTLRTRLFAGEFQVLLVVLLVLVSAFAVGVTVFM